MGEFEHTPREMANKLLFFNYYLSDDRDEVIEELESVTETFTKLQKSKEFNALISMISSNLKKQKNSSRKSLKAKLNI